MSELIDRKAAIKATWQEPSYTDPLNVLTEVRDRIKAIPAPPRWHRVEDELPDRYDAYVVGWRYPNGCFYWGKVLFFNDKWQVDEEIPTPDYWMPIEPPKEDA